MKKIGIVLFTTDLRLHDNATLNCAIKENDLVIPLFCWDEETMNQFQFGFPRVGSLRIAFLNQVLHDLHIGLKGIGGLLLVRKGKQIDILSEIANEFSIHKVYTKKQVGIEEKRQNDSLKSILRSKGIDFEEYSTSTLYHPSDLPFSMSSIPEVFTKFRKIVEKEVVVRDPISAPTKINCPPIPKAWMDFSFSDSNTQIEKGFSLPKLGGEQSALKHLNWYIFENQHLLHYKETRNELLGLEFSSKLSPWLAMGCISPKYVCHEVKRFENEFKANESTYWLIFELLWRDFFRFSFKKHPIEYFQLHGIIGKSERTTNCNESLIDKWIEGKTENNFVNAAMYELKATGWMSNRMRQIVASYFIYDLAQDWRIGAAYFESQLIDYDVSSNWGNWAYIAGVGNDPRAGRQFNLEKQEEQYDRDKRYQNTWNIN
jgi:deoxyribodipyrimidine photo-lyase